MKTLLTSTAPALLAASNEEGSAPTSRRKGKVADMADFSPLGDYGVTWSRQGDTLLLAIDISAKARKSAPLSESGKNQLIAKTGPFVAIPGSDVKLMVNATIPVDQTNPTLVSQSVARRAAAKARLTVG